MLRYAKYKKLSSATADIQKRLATQVLYEKMVFYDNRAIRLYAEIREHLKEDVKKGAPIRGDLMAQMLKHMQKANEVCIECAAKLAPYQSPRLQSMEVNKKVTHRFVIQAPQQIENSNEWLQQVNSNNQVKLLESTAHEVEES